MGFMGERFISSAAAIIFPLALGLAAPSIAFAQTNRGTEDQDLASYAAFMSQQFPGCAAADPESELRSALAGKVLLTFPFRPLSESSAANAQTLRMSVLQKAAGQILDRVDTPQLRYQRLSEFYLAISVKELEAAASTDEDEPQRIFGYMSGCDLTKALTLATQVGVEDSPTD